MPSTRVDVRRFERPDFPQFGWLYFATEQAAVANAGIFRPAFAQALVDAWLWEPTPEIVYGDWSQLAWIFSALPTAFDAAFWPAICQLSESSAVIDRASHRADADEWAQSAWIFTAIPATPPLRMLRGMGT